MTEDERWIGGIKTGPPCSGCNKSPSRGSIERRSPEDGVTVDEMPLGEYPPLTADMLGTSVRPAGPDLDTGTPSL